MRVIIQRVNRASVEVSGEIISQIRKGLLVLVGVADGDNESDAEYLAAKISAMRIFPDAVGKMNLSVTDISGELLVVSQFTLHALTKKGNRPSFVKAAPPETAKILYEHFLQRLCDLSGIVVVSGRFGAMMNVELENWGPVTIFVDSANPE
jgi:D-tyrosyl-tRNA(Tyr) deacylase